MENLNLETKSILKSIICGMFSTVFSYKTVTYCFEKNGLIDYSTFVDV